MILQQKFKFQVLFNIDNFRFTFILNIFYCIIPSYSLLHVLILINH